MNTILTDDEIHKWWASENGMEDADMAKLNDFREVTRKVEAAVLAKLREQEPVAVYHGRCTIDCGEHGHHDMEMLKMIPAGSKLYAAPQPAVVQVPQGWRPVTVKLPDFSEDQSVLCFCDGYDYGGSQFITLRASDFYEFDPENPDEPGTAESKTVSHWIDELAAIQWAKTAAPEAPAQRCLNCDDIIRMAREAGKYADAEYQRAWEAGEGASWQDIRDERFATLVAAPWREAVNVAREALKEMVSITEIHQRATKQNFAWAELPEARAAIAQLDSLGGGE